MTENCEMQEIEAFRVEGDASGITICGLPFMSKECPCVFLNDCNKSVHDGWTHSPPALSAYNHNKHSSWQRQTPNHRRHYENNKQMQSLTRVFSLIITTQSCHARRP